MNEINSVDDAVEKAGDFLEEYYLFRRLESAKKSGAFWIVKFDVSIIGPKEIVTIKLDPKTGDVLEYTKSNK